MFRTWCAGVHLGHHRAAVEGAETVVFGQAAGEPVRKCVIKVQGLGFRVLDLGFEIYGLGFVI